MACKHPDLSAGADTVEVARQYEVFLRGGSDIASQMVCFIEQPNGGSPEIKLTQAQWDAVVREWRRLGRMITSDEVMAIIEDPSRQLTS
ncbi:MAG: hypothetical protein WC107_06205 [Patescibacteria group bacterium]